LVEVRQRHGKGRAASYEKSRKSLSDETLLKTYQNDDERKKILLRKATATQSEMLFLTQSLWALLSDENFIMLLRAEGIANIPKTIADRLTRCRGTKS
jgi:ParB family chromosome partitioning protein